MRLLRYFPVPSDRMGTIWTLLSLDKAVVLEYGPAGTTHYSMTFFNSMGLETNGRIYTTDMNDSDVIMGDTDKLEKAVLEIDRQYEPQVIFVLASSTSEVIGTDIKGVCKSLEAKAKARLIPFAVSGLSGDYARGISSCLLKLVRELVKESEGGTEEQLTDAVDEVNGQNTFNVLGMTGWKYRGQSDLWEVENLLREGFDLKLGCSPGLNCSIEKIENMTKAVFNLVLSWEGLKMAEYLQEKYGMPFIYLPPYGYEKTLELLQQVSLLVGKEVNRSLVERLQEKQQKLKAFGMLQRRMTEGKYPQRALLKGELDFIQGVGEFLETLGFKQQQRICDYSLKNLQAEKVDFYKEENQWLQVVRQQEHSLVLGSDIVLEEAGTSNVKVRTAYPLLVDNVTATHLPFMGEKGADMLLEQVKEYFYRIR